MPSVDPMFASVGAIYGAGALGRRAHRHGPRRSRRRGRAGRLRRLGHRPGRGELRGVGHAARGARSRTRQRGACRPTRSPAGSPRAPRSSASADKRQLQPNPRRPARGPDRSATDDEPPLADRDRAFARCCASAAIGTLDELITILVMGKEPSLSQMVVEALLNNETYFFRDRAPFDLLSAPCAAGARAAPRQRAKRLRIWSAGCSTGQEVYSLAMLFAEDPEKWRGWTIDILGTDVSTELRRSRARRRLQPVRGPARPWNQPDDQMVRGVRRRLARGRAAAQAGPFPGPQSSSSSRRIPASSTSSCAATCCSISARRRRRLPSSGSPRPWPRTAG